MECAILVLAPQGAALRHGGRRAGRTAAAPWCGGSTARIEELAGCDQTVLEAGEAVTVITPTGGGYGVADQAEYADEAEPYRTVGKGRLAVTPGAVDLTPSGSKSVYRDVANWMIAAAATFSLSVKVWGVSGRHGRPGPPPPVTHATLARPRDQRTKSSTALGGVIRHASSR